MAKTLYDTSILIAAARQSRNRLLGVTTILNVIEFPKAVTLQGLKVLFPQRRDYDEALRLSAQLLVAGHPIPAVDLLVAAMAITRGLTLKTADAHFEAVAALRNDFRLSLAPS